MWRLGSHGISMFSWWLDSHGICMDLMWRLESHGTCMAFMRWLESHEIVRLRCCVLPQCCQDSLRVHLRKAYHKYVEEKQVKGMVSAFDTFLEEMVDYMDNQVQEEDEEMGTGPRG